MRNLHRRSRRAVAPHSPTRGGAWRGRPGPPKAKDALEGGRRVAITLADQGLSSVSNFAVAVAVARGAGASGLGGFTLAFAGWTVLGAVHRSLVTDPMAIDGDVRDPRAVASVRRGFGAEVLLGIAGALCLVVVGGVLLSVGQHTFGVSVLSMALWMPVLVVQDYWRWVGFMSRRPGKALANDALFNVVQAGGFTYLLVHHVHSVSLLIGAWGLGALTGGLFGMWQYRALPNPRGGMALLKERWSFSKWMAGSNVTGWFANQALVVVAGAILGPAGLGAFRACQNLAGGPAGVLIQAGGSVGLPETSKSYAEGGLDSALRTAWLVTAAGFASVFAGAALVFLWGRTLLTLVYGPSFAHLQSAAEILSVGYLFLAFYLGPVLMLKVTKDTRKLMYVEVFSVVLGLATLGLFATAFGVKGAALAELVTSIVTAAAFVRAQQSIRRRRLGLRGTAAGAPAGGPQAALGTGGAPGPGTSVTCQVIHVEAAEPEKEPAL
ncbi:MAG TPA: oligosaccharide flippase family protein [Acidimicrobiales bacterium]|nr:oligosaccharide flippase family protein [Acidimicrobiales bacterium]